MTKHFCDVCGKGCFAYYREYGIANHMQCLELCIDCATKLDTFIFGLQDGTKTLP